MKRINPLILILTTLMALLSCNQKGSLIEDSDKFLTDYEKWQATRLERLKSENGWLNLAGLFWLEEGSNTFGSNESNTIVFPGHFPQYAGEIILQDSIITIDVADDITVTSDSKRIDVAVLNHDQQDSTTILAHESFRWFIIKRGEQYGIRLRDLNHPRLKELDHIPSYPLSEKWVVEAELIPYDSVRVLEVPTVITNFSEFYDVPGELKFKINGKMQTLLPFSAGKGFFLIVGDATNGIDTYGAGRFMYTDQVEGNRVILDFNRAYNPPCAFSPFATCPLPPLENILEIKIEAGEKGVHLE